MAFAEPCSEQETTVQTEPAYAALDDLLSTTWFALLGLQQHSIEQRRQPLEVQTYDPNTRRVDSVLIGNLSKNLQVLPILPNLLDLERCVTQGKPNRNACI